MHTYKYNKLFFIQTKYVHKKIILKKLIIFKKFNNFNYF